MAKQSPTPTWTELAPGTAVTDPGSARDNRTGDWRSQRPVVDVERCIRCGVCWVFCPDMAIVDAGTHFEADLEFCKGCGICARECWTGCITLVEEEV